MGFALKTLFLILHTYVPHDLRRTLAFLGTKSNSNLEPELCIVSALIVHHLLLNDDETLRMLRMPRGGHLFIAGSEIRGQG